MTTQLMLFSPDWKGNESKGFVLEVLASAPTPYGIGHSYFDSVLGRPQVWDGGAWINFAPGSGGSGSVETVAIASANGLAGTSDGDPTDPVITLRTTITGLLKGNGTAISAATSATDYAPATSGSVALKGDGAGGFANATLNDVGAATADYSLNSHKLTNVTDPTSPQDAATRAYVDAIAQGLDFKASARVIVTTNGTLATAYENGDTASGVTLATGDRIVLGGQTTGSENGIYTVNASGAPTRAADANASGELSKGAVIYIEAGTNAGQLWIVSATASTPWVPGTDSSTWTQFSGAADITGGAGLVKVANDLAVGQGTGIIVNANDVAIDPSYTSHGTSGTFGNAAATTFTLTHNLGTKKISVTFRDTVSDNSAQIAWHHNSTNQIAIDTGAYVPAAAQFEVTVQGIT